jgi:hypothetical protein
LPDTSLGGQQPTDELDGVVPQPCSMRVPQNGAAIVKALLAEGST